MEEEVELLPSERLIASSNFIRQKTFQALLMSNAVSIGLCLADR